MTKKININERIINNKEIEDIENILNNIKENLFPYISNNSNIEFLGNRLLRSTYSFQYQSEICGSITINIVVYLCDEDWKLEVTSDYIGGDTDYKNKEITITISIDTRNVIIDYGDMENMLYHEYHHIYQFSHFVPNDDDFYDKIDIGRNSPNKYIRTLSLCLYYSVNTEEDAFMAQLYDFTKSNFKYNKEDLGYRNVIENFPYIKDFFNKVYELTNEEKGNHRSSIETEVLKIYNVPLDVLLKRIDSHIEQWKKKIWYVLAKVKNEYIRENRTINHQQMIKHSKWIEECLSKGYKPSLEE